MKILTFLFLAFSSSTCLYAQSIYLGADTSVCGIQSINIQTSDQIVYLDNPQSIVFEDDKYSGVVDIGFTFNYYGINYNQLIIGSNGIISFNLADSNDFCPWNTVEFPAALVKNSIALAWQDLYFPFAGSLYYQAIGTAPNRKFVVNYENVGYFHTQCHDPLDCFTGTLILYENSNDIEMFIANKSYCPVWNNGEAVQGIQDSLAVNFNVVAGRNNTQWTTQLDGRRFSPINAISYNQTAIPFVMSVTVFSDNLVWSSTTGQVFPFQQNQPLTVQSVVGETIGYFLSATSCGAVFASVSDSSFVSTSSFQISNARKVSCPGGSDGTATVNIVPIPSGVTYLWDDPLGQTTQTAIDLSAGIYTCFITSPSGCEGIDSVEIEEIPGMLVEVAEKTDVLCNSDSTGFIRLNVVDGTGPFTFLWDKSNSVTNIANDLPAGISTIIVTDSNNCITTIMDTILQPDSLSLTFVTLDSQLCPTSSMNLTAEGAGGSSAYTYTWFENGNQIAVGQTIEVTPTNEVTNYCVVLSEECGSPAADTCLVVTFFPDIVSELVMDKYKSCLPALFEFDLFSLLENEISNVNYDFGDGTSLIDQNSDPITHSYTSLGFYTIITKIESTHGCLYIDTMVNLLQARPNPIADFMISSTPTTMFETEISMTDNSSAGVVNWEWSSPFSFENSSTMMNPIFNFPIGQVGEYPVTLQVFDQEGCTDSITKFVDVITDVIFYAPNTFTPDDDKFNGTWKIIIDGLSENDFLLSVYDRWGQLVWSANDLNAEWDGTYHNKQVQDGTYSWIAVGSDLISAKKHIFSGHINIIK